MASHNTILEHLTAAMIWEKVSSSFLSNFAFGDGLSQHSGLRVEKTALRIAPRRSFSDTFGLISLNYRPQKSSSA
jgi:hypothetical protein